MTCSCRCCSRRSVSDFFTDLQIKESTNPIEKLQQENEQLKAQLEEAEEVIDFYADKSNWEIPDVDSRGFGGMSSKSIIELGDHDFPKYRGGKRAREYNNKYKGSKSDNLE